MTYTVLISVDPSDVQLLPAMTATVTIITQAADNAVIVPNTALAYAQSKTATGATLVDVLRNGALTPVQVQTGITDGVSTQIVSGLSAGDQVVTGVSSTTVAKTTSKTTSILSTGGGTGGPPPNG